MSRVTSDAIAVARREVLDLDHDDPAVRSEALATLAQAVHRLELADLKSLETPARITHFNGELIARYTEAGDRR